MENEAICVLFSIKSQLDRRMHRVANAVILTVFTNLTFFDDVTQRLAC